MSCIKYLRIYKEYIKMFAIYEGINKPSGNISIANFKIYLNKKE